MGGTTFFTTNVFSNLKAGTYNVVVSKSDGSCPVSYQPIVLATPSGIAISTVTTTKPTLCGLSNGAITIAVTPSGTYQYSINGGQTFQASATFSSLPQGNYSIVAKSATTGCTAYYTTNPLVLAPQSCPEICNDGIDNDGVGGIDNCPDGTCGLTPLQVLVTQTNCSTNAKGTISVNATHTYKGCSNLAAGAITFTYYSTGSGSFYFSFVPLVNIAAGTALIFTDKGWVNSSTGFRAGEGVLQWTAPTGGVLAGTKIDIVGITMMGNYNVSTTLGTIKKDNNIPNASAYGTNLSFDLGTGGDQIIALCGTSFASTDLSNLVFLAAINANATSWNSGGATNDKTSAIPPGLTNGTTAMAVGNTASWSTTAPTIDNTITYSINGGETFQASGTFANLSPGFYRVLVKKGSCITAYPGNPVQIYACSETCGDGIDNDGNSKADCLDAACSVGGISVATTLPGCPPVDTFGKVIINLSGTGGASYQYSLNNGVVWQASATFNALNPGNYTVKIKRNNTACETAYSGNPVVLTVPVCTEVCNDGFDNDKDGLIDCDDPDCGVASSEYEVRMVAPSCPTNAANGKITILRKFPTGPTYLYSKDGGQTFQSDTTFANLAPGTYLIAIKNQSTGCVVLYPGNPVVLTAPTCPEICNNSIDDDGDGLTDCADTDCGVAPYAVDLVRPNCPPAAITGSITITPFGAASNYQYSKDNGSTWQNAPTFTNLPEGDYPIKVKRISSGCTLAYTGNPIVLRRVLCQEICGDGIDNDLDSLIDCADPDCNMPKIEGITSTAPTYCYNSDGSITVLAVNNGGGSGNPADWEYSKDNGVSWQNSNVFGGLATGTYTLKVRNKVSGCQLPNGSAGASTTVTLQPANAGTGISVLINANPASFCNDNDGRLTITSTNGIFSYQYRINGGAWGAGNIFSNLSSGNYVVEVSANGGKCISSTTVNLPKRADITITGAISNRNCTNNSGAIQITASTTESLALQYSINDGSTWSDSSSFTNLAAGTYQIAVRYKTDTRCVKRYAMPVVIEAFVPINISQITATATTKCTINDGIITITASGNKPLEYRLENGQWQTSNQFTGLAPANYHVYVRYGSYLDSVCVLGYSSEPIRVAAPLAPVIDSVVAIQLSGCALINGELSVYPLDSLLYRYSIDGGVTFQNINAFSNLDTGSYRIVIQNKNTECFTNYSSNPVTLARLTSAEICGDSLDNDCNGRIDCDDPVCAVAPYEVNVIQPYCGDTIYRGSIQFVADSISDYQYSVNNGASWQTAIQFDSLPLGRYFLVKKNTQSGCVQFYENNPISLLKPFCIELCGDNKDNDKDGFIDCDDTDCGVAPYTLDITQPAYVKGAINIKSSDNKSYQYSIDGGVTAKSLPVFRELEEGDYYVVVAGNGCEREYENNPVELRKSTNLLQCKTYEDIGEPTNLDYCVKWFPDTDLANKESSETRAEPKTTTLYRLVVTDYDGNVVIDKEYLVEIQSIPLTISPNNAAICEPGGSVKLQAITDNNPNYTYHWSTGATTPSITVSQTLNYGLTVTDETTGCQQSDSEQVELELLDANIRGSSNYICEGDVVMLRVSVNSTGSELAYNWSNGATTSTINIEYPGDYKVTVTNTETGCISADEFKITAEAFLLGIGSSKPSICSPSPITLTVGGNYSLPVTYNWARIDAQGQPIAFGGSTASVAITQPGKYQVTVIEDNNCKGTATIEIAETEDKSIQIQPSPAIICEGQEIELSAPQEPGTYEWNSVDGNFEAIAGTPHKIMVSEAGTYSLTITDAEGCKSVGSAKVESQENGDGIKQTLESQGFVCIPITVTRPGALKQGGTDLEKNNGAVDNQAPGAEFSFQTVTGESMTTEQLALLLEAQLGENACGLTPKGLITNNNSFCKPGFYGQNKGDFSSSGVGIWMHLYNGAGDNDCLYVRGFGQEGQGGSLQTEYFNYLLDKLGQDPDNYGLASSSEKLLSFIINEATTAYIDTIPPVQTTPSPNGVTLAPIYPTGDLELIPDQLPCQSDSPIVGISPSGLPVWLPAKSTPRFGIRDRFEGLIDERALTGFTVHTGVNKGIYRAYTCGGGSRFSGYKKFTGKRYTFDITKIPPDKTPAWLGEFDNVPCPASRYIIQNVLYDYSTKTKTADAIGTGELVEDFESNILTKIKDVDDVLYLCNGVITEEGYNRPFRIDLQRLPLGQITGWVMYVRNTNGDTENIYVQPQSNGTYLYYRMLCDGQLQLTNGFEEWNLLSKMLYDLKDGIIASGHTILDIIGIVFEPADYVNAAWYFLEGNTVDGTLTLATSGPGVDVFYKAGKLFARIGGKVLESLGVIVRYTDEGGNIVNAARSAEEVIAGANRLRMTDDQITKYAKWLDEFIATNQSNAKFALNIIDDIDITKIWKYADEAGLDNAKLTQLFDDLAGNVDLLNAFKTKPELVKAWNALADYSLLRKNPLNLTKIDDYIANSSDDFTSLKNKLESISSLTAKEKFINDLEEITSFNTKTGLNTKASVDNDLLQTASSAQGSGAYPGIDNWIVVEIPVGSKIYGGIPGQSNFYTPYETITGSNFDKVKVWESLQVEPHPTFGYRTQMAEYQITGNIKIAISKTLENPQHGAGGAYQAFVDNFANNVTPTGNIINLQ